MAINTLLKGLFGTAFQHSQQARRPCFVTHRREVNHDGDVLVTPACMPPNMLIHTEHGHTVKPLWVIKKQALTFFENSAINSVPSNAQMVCNARYRQVIQHDGSQCPAHRTTGKL